MTLEMSATEAEALVTAQTEGKLQLALRNPLNLEKKAVAVAPPAPAPVMAMAAAPVPKPVVQRSAKPQGGAITLIRGVESSVINVR